MCFHRFFCGFLFCFLCFSFLLQAQKIRKEDFIAIDSFVQEVDALEGYSLQYICDSITKNAKNELEVSRAFYFWLAHHVQFDFKRKKHPERTDNASTALMERRAASKGFAEIFQAMCQIKKIDCRVIKGLIRYRTQDLLSLDDKELHYWNIITVNNTHFLIDASMAMGGFDEKGKYIIKQFTDAWWLCNRRLFVLSHFPDNKEDQLLEMPLSKRDFAKNPLCYPSTIVLALVPSGSFNGIMKGVAEDSTTLKFNVGKGFRFVSASVQFDLQKPIPLNYDIDAFGFYLKVPNGPEGKHLAKIYCNGALTFTYRVDNRKKLKKRKA